MAYILHLDTATELCSVALSDGDRLLDSRESSAEQNHAGILTVFIQELLENQRIRPSDLSAVAVSKGAGSYTGLRVGFSVAKGLCYGLEKPIILVDTLAALNDAMQKAADYQQNSLFFPAIDARRMDAYAALYDQSQKRLIPIDCYTIYKGFFAAYTEQNQHIVLGGNAAAKIQQFLGEDPAKISLSAVQKNSAQHLISLAWGQFEAGDFADVAYCEPFYLKPPFATVAKPIF